MARPYPSTYRQSPEATIQSVSRHLRPSSLAFSLIELLIVISIIALLMGLILAILPVVRRAVAIHQTRTILSAAQLAVSSAGLRSVNISPVVHPLANTASQPMPRSPFFRGETIQGVFNQGDAIALVGEALVVAEPKTIALSEIDRLMWPTDCYAGTPVAMVTDNPLIFGVTRQHLNILGSGMGLVHYRSLPTVQSWNDLNKDGVLDNPPYVASPMSGVRYTDTNCLVDPTGDITSDVSYEVDNKKLFDYALGPEVQGELASLGGLKTTMGGGTGLALISNYRLRNAPEYAGLSMSSYDSNRMQRVSICQDIDGMWKAYRLRGTALYDAWGHEILFYLSANGSFTFESAGPDGFFRWNPGPDQVYQTSASDSVPTGDDRDGSADNIYVGPR